MYMDFSSCAPSKWSMNLRTLEESLSLQGKSTIVLSYLCPIMFFPMEVLGKIWKNIEVIVLSALVHAMPCHTD